MRAAAFIRCGKLCGKCSLKHCADDKDIELKCPICNGHGCEHCKGGWFEVPGCVQRFVSPMLPAIRMADAYHKGFLPVAGGVLDQSASFIEFVSQLEYEDALAKRDDD